MAEPHVATTEVPSGEHAEATAFGLFAAPGIVALAMVVVIALLLWKKVPAAIGKGLDQKIAAIREQLDEAAALRKEAEAIRAEYEAKAKASAEDARQLIERAHHEAEAILAKAKDDAEQLVERRGRIAEDKIAAEERAALAELRSKTADAAARAAVRLIAERGDGQADKALVDQAIAGMARR